MFGVVLCKFEQDPVKHYISQFVMLALCGLMCEAFGLVLRVESPEAAVGSLKIIACITLQTHVMSLIVFLKSVIESIV